MPCLDPLCPLLPQLAETPLLAQRIFSAVDRLRFIKPHDRFGFRIDHSSLRTQFDHLFYLQIRIIRSTFPVPQLAKHSPQLHAAPRLTFIHQTKVRRDG